MANFRWKDTGLAMNTRALLRVDLRGAFFVVRDKENVFRQSTSVKQ